MDLQKKKKVFENRHHAIKYNLKIDAQQITPALHKTEKTMALQTRTASKVTHQVAGRHHETDTQRQINV
jgi:hypothetical protein